MKTLRNKILAITIALILMISIGASMMIIPKANAHIPSMIIPTYAFVTSSPNPIGLGQSVEVVYWVDKVPPTANTAYGDRWKMSVVITDPNNQNQTYGPYTTSDVGGGDFMFTPTIIGNYTLQAFFPTQVLAGVNPPPTGNTSPFINDTYTASISPPATLVVQSEPITSYPLNPLPTDYWNFPINGMNPAWTLVSGDWLLSSYDAAGNRYNPYTTAPTSAHILWTDPIAAGGVVGGNYTDFNYYTGLAYETKFNSPIIMNGNLYFNLPRGNNVGVGGTTCINLKTGQQKWYEPDALNTLGVASNPTALGYNLGETNVINQVSFGQNLDYQSPNQYGITSYIWTTVSGAGNSTYNIYEPDTGQYLYSITNVSFTGTNTFDANGNLCVYIWNAAGGWLAMWNFPLDIMHYMQNVNVWEWRPMQTFPMDWKYGLQWNNTNEPILRDGNGLTMAIDHVVPDDGVIVMASGSIGTPESWQWEAGFSTTDGHNLWQANRTEPIGATTWALLGPAENGVYTEFRESTMTWYAYSLYTGDQVWGPTTPYPQAFGSYSWQTSIAYGYLLGLDFAGYVHAFNISTGIEAWSFFTGSSGTSTPYGTWVLNNPPPTSAGGLIYVVAGHAYNPPLYPGAQIYCINATNGNLVWSELGFYTYDPVEVADGVLLCYNCYDGQIYCYGQGLSATTITAPEVGIPEGNQVLIQGTVTDQSPAKATSLGAPAAGTPAISDDSMSAWMAYLYMQQPMPTNATGVTVTLTAIDPNGNLITLGQATSDDIGKYAFPWTAPTVPGLYKVTATFSGTNSYYSSSAETNFIVTSGATTTVAPTAIPTSAADMYFIPAIAGLFILIIVGLVLLALLMLRKRP